MKKYLRVLLALIAIAATVLYLFGCPSPTGPSDNGSTLSSDATLSALGMVWIDLGPIDFGFVQTTTTYNRDVPNSLTQVDVTPVANQSGATIKVNGTSVASGSPITILFSVGANVVDVVVTAEDGSTVQSYTVTVNRAASVSTNANLAYLMSSVGTLDPDFDENTLSYDVDVAYAEDEIALTPFVSDQAATVKVDENDVTHATASDPITLSPGANLIDVVVTAGDGVTTKTYTVTVTRAAPPSNNANLSNLEPTEGSLSPVFSAATISYTVDVSNSVSSIQFSPTAEDPNYDGITVDGVSVVSGAWSVSISLSVGANVVHVEVTAEDTVTTKTYTVTVNRAKPSISGTITNSGSGSIGPTSPLIVWWWYEQTDTEYLASYTSGTFPFDYTISDLEDGYFEVGAVLDNDNNSVVSPGDLFGQYGSGITISGLDLTGIDLPIGPLVDGTITVAVYNASAANGHNAYFVVVAEGDDPVSDPWLGQGFFLISSGAGEAEALDGVGGSTVTFTGGMYDVYIYIDTDDSGGLLPNSGEPVSDDSVVVSGDVDIDFDYVNDFVPY